MLIPSFSGIKTQLKKYFLMHIIKLNMRISVTDDWFPLPDSFSKERNLNLKSFPDAYYQINMRIASSDERFLILFPFVVIAVSVEGGDRHAKCGCGNLCTFLFLERDYLTTRKMDGFFFPGPSCIAGPLVFTGIIAVLHTEEGLAISDSAGHKKPCNMTKHAQFLNIPSQIFSRNNLKQ